MLLPKAAAAAATTAVPTATNATPGTKLTYKPHLLLCLQCEAGIFHSIVHVDVHILPAQLVQQPGALEQRHHLRATETVGWVHTTCGAAGGANGGGGGQQWVGGRVGRRGRWGGAVGRSVSSEACASSRGLPWLPLPSPLICRQ